MLFYLVVSILKILFYLKSSNNNMKISYQISYFNKKYMDNIAMNFSKNKILRPT